MKIEIIIKIKINVFKKYDKIIKTNENSEKHNQMGRNEIPSHLTQKT